MTSKKYFARWMKEAGSVIPAVIGYVMMVFYGYVFVEKVLTVFAKTFFDTYYRILAFERLSIVLNSIDLSRKLVGSDLYEKHEIWSYIPETIYLLAGLGWCAVLLVMIAIAHRKRKIERLGKIFAVESADTMAEVFVSVLMGLWGGSIFTNILGVSGKSSVVIEIINFIIGILAVFLVHILFVRVVNKSQKSLLSQRCQLAVECMLVCLAGSVFSLEHLHLTDSFRQKTMI